MKIASVETILLRKPLSSTMRISRGGFKERVHALVRVTTDSGLTGLGEGVGNADMVRAIVDGSMGPKCIGRNPMEIESLRRHLTDGNVYFERRGSAICAASAIEMACWDIKGKSLGVPVYELLGGKCRETLEAYASDIYWQENPESMGEHSRKVAEKGFKAVKAHLGCRPAREDIARVAAIRKGIGVDCRLMIDLNAGYGNLDAAEAVAAWGAYDLMWLEEPVHPDSVGLMADLRAKAAMPLAAGENEFSLQGFKELFDSRAVDVAMPDLGRAGGILGSKAICVLAEGYGITVSPHNFSSGILLAATMQLMACTPNTRWLEIDSSDNPVYEELLVEPLRFENGAVRIPAHPGLGVVLTEETLRKYAAG
jgi:D-galactarolactone cycloisomerase